MTTNIIWDWNGTLLNDVHACVGALNVVLQASGREPVEVDDYRREFTFPVKDYYVALGFDFDREDWAGIADAFHEAYAETSKGVKLRDGIIGLVKGLKKSGVKMAVLSASEQGLLESMMANCGIAEYFAGSIYGLQDLFAGSS